MNQIKKKLFLLLLATNILTCYSQINYVDGYVITNEMDTIYGKIKDINFQKKSLKCFFKNKATGKVEVFSPGDIYGYFFLDSKAFLSKDYGKEDTLKGMLFKEVLFDGNIRILMLSIDKGHRFYIEKDLEYYPLTNTAFKTHVDGVERTRFRQEYKGVLIYLLSETPILQEKIQKTQLNPESLISLAKEYQFVLGTKPENYQVPYYTSSIKYKVSVWGNLKYNNYTHNHRDQNTTRTVYVPSLNPEYGLRLDLKIPKISAEPYIGISFEKFSGSGKGTFVASTWETSTYSIYPFVDYSRASTEFGLSLPLNSFLYPSTAYFGVNINYLTNFRVYQFPDSPDRITPLYLGDYLLDRSYSKLNLGVTIGIKHLVRLNNNYGIAIGPEVSLWSMKFGDARKFNPSIGVVLGITYLN